MKNCLFLILFLFLASFSADKKGKNLKAIVISQSSKLEIVGSTNVNNFTCSFNVGNLNKPLQVGYEIGNETVIFQNSTLILENSFFDCGGRGINKDFQELLRTKEYPQILLTLNEIEKRSFAGNIVKASVEIQIAGLSRTYKVDVQTEKKETLHIAGKLEIKIADFNLEVPKKMMGMIVVSEEVEIVFDLILEELDVGLKWD